MVPSLFQVGVFWLGVGFLVFLDFFVLQLYAFQKVSAESSQVCDFVLVFYLIPFQEVDSPSKRIQMFTV